MTLAEKVQELQKKWDCIHINYYGGSDGMWRITERTDQCGVFEDERTYEAGTLEGAIDKALAGKPTKNCPDCEGQGGVTYGRAGVGYITDDCEACNGTGRVDE